MKLTNETKLFLSIMIVTLVVILASVWILSGPSQNYKRSQLLPENVATRGSTEAEIYLVEFSDFQCPACKSFQPAVDQILQKHGDRLLFAYRHFPLPQHSYAQYAAEAFEAAKEQGKAWAMHDYLFENQEILSEQIIDEGAKKIGLNTDQFTQKIRSGEYKAKIQRDAEDGQRFGVDATPTFFLNGKKLSPSSPADLIQAVDDASL